MATRICCEVSKFAMFGLTPGTCFAKGNDFQRLLLPNCAQSASLWTKDNKFHQQLLCKRTSSPLSVTSLYLICNSQLTFKEESFGSFYRQLVDILNKNWEPWSSHSNTKFFAFLGTTVSTPKNHPHMNHHRFIDPVSDSQAKSGHYSTVGFCRIESNPCSLAWPLPIEHARFSWQSVKARGYLRI